MNSPLYLYLFHSSHLCCLELFKEAGSVFPLLFMLVCPILSMLLLCPLRPYPLRPVAPVFFVPEFRRYIALMIFFILISSACLPSAAVALEQGKLPHAAGECVNRAQNMMQKGRFSDAIHELKAFKAKGKGVSEKVAVQNGYNHYYIDYMLGNAFMMLAEDESEDEKKENILPGKGGGKGKKGEKGGKGEERSSDLKKKAVRYYEHTVRKKDDIAAVWLNLAVCRYDLGRMEAAAAAFLKGYGVSEEKYKKAMHLYYGAVCYFQSGGKKNQTKALQVFKKLIRLHPGEISFDWLESYLSMLFTLNQNKAALPYIRKLIEKFNVKKNDKNSAKNNDKNSTKNSYEKRRKWQEILLYQYLHLNMEKSALKYARYLAKSDPVEPKWWKGLSHIYLNRNDLAKGLRSLIVYGFLTPLTRDEETLMADLYLSLNIPSMAVPYYEKILKEGFDREKARRLLHACLLSEQPEKALEWIDLLLEEKEDIVLLRQKEALDFQIQYRLGIGGKW